MADLNVTGEQAPPDPSFGDNGSGSNSAQSGNSGFNPLSLVVPGAVGLAGYLGGQQTNQINQQNFNSAMDFAGQQSYLNYQRQLSLGSTGYQRSVADMKAAGLNPVLAGMNGPESAPGSAQASAPGVPPMQNIVGNATSSALQAAQTVQDLRSSDADILVKQANALNLAAKTNTEGYSAEREAEQTHQLAMQSKALGATYKATEGEAAARLNRSNLDLENDARERLLNQLKTGMQIGNSAASIIKPFGGGGGGYNESDMLNAAKGRGVLVP